jgi:hypothetical protein
MTDTPATIEDIEVAIKRAYQMGQLEVVGRVNVQRVRVLKERFDRLETQLQVTPDDELLRKTLRVRKQLLRACETGVRNELKLKELMEQ